MSKQFSGNRRNIVLLFLDKQTVWYMHAIKHCHCKGCYFDSTEAMTLSLFLNLVVNLLFANLTHHLHSRAAIKERIKAARIACCQTLQTVFTFKLISRHSLARWPHSKHGLPVAATTHLRFLYASFFIFWKRFLLLMACSMMRYDTVDHWEPPLSETMHLQWLQTNDCWQAWYSATCIVILSSWQFRSIRTNMGQLPWFHTTAQQQQWNSTMYFAASCNCNKVPYIYVQLHSSKVGFDPVAWWYRASCNC